MASKVAVSLRTVACYRRMARRRSLEGRSKVKRRILAIDGGGVKGIFPASFLAEVENALSIRSVADYFDLIAGTSSGGIIAIGLGLGFSAREIVDLFQQQGAAIFPHQIFPTSLLRVLCGFQRYEPNRLREALTRLFGDKTLADSRVRLLIPSFDAGRADIHIYKTRHHSRLCMDFRVSAVEVSMATAAAPTYFPAYDSIDGITLIDGGIWANNPVALAVIEGIAVLGWDPDEIDVLSIGCTEEVVDFRQRGHSGLFWLRRAIDAAMRGQSRSALGMARHLTVRDRGVENIIRVDPAVAANVYSLDGVKQMRELSGLGYSQARHKLPEMRERFFGAQAVPFTPLTDAS